MPRAYASRVRAIAVALLLSGCTLYFGDSGGDGSNTVDIPPDAANAPPYMPPTSCQPGYVQGTWRCEGSSASFYVTNYYQGAGTHSMCTSVLVSSSVTCAAGCAVQGSISLSGAAAFPAVTAFGNNAAVLCAETPPAHDGDACGSNHCLPTRAAVDANGIVVGQDYLQCNSSNNRCSTSAAPPRMTYMDPCDPNDVTTYAVPNATGAAGSGSNVCLIAWDDAAQKSVWNQTTQCMGDWQCPAQMLCDDQLPRLPSSASTIGVCKPGPRGTLTPAMVAP
ncbi:MAG TPA: hypothetical protein VL326_00680 [Kofleriaceae bacterium]|nr:hypothetical protein [Kofleriaceae bacterium]